MSRRLKAIHYVAEAMNALEAMPVGGIGADGLVIDDVGAERVSEWSSSAVYNLISQRINRRRAMVVTSNLSLDEIGRRIDPRLASRLAGLTVLTLAGPDRRIRGA